MRLLCLTYELLPLEYFSQHSEVEVLWYVETSFMFSWLVFKNVSTTAHARWGYFECPLLLLISHSYIQELHFSSSDTENGSVSWRLYFVVAVQSRIFCSKQLNSILITISWNAYINVLNNMSVLDVGLLIQPMRSVLLLLLSTQFGKEQAWNIMRRIITGGRWKNMYRYCKANRCNNWIKLLANESWIHSALWLGRFSLPWNSLWGFLFYLCM